MLDRFTRDEVSAKIWWPLALLGVVALILTVPGANRAAELERARSADWAAAVSAASIQPLTNRGALPGEISMALSRIVESDRSWTAARVWDVTDSLVASSVRSEQLQELGSGEAFNDAEIEAAIAEGADRVVTDRLPTGDPGPTTFHAYTKIDGVGGPFVTEFEARDAVLLAEVHHDWLWYRIVAAVATALLLGLAALSMREPIAPIGAGVAFYPGSVPPDQAVIDVDRAVALEQAGGRAKDRVAGLQQRLDESEQMRLKAEGQLQQALAALGAGSRAMPIPRPASPPEAPAPVASPEPEPVVSPAPVAPAPGPEPVVSPAPVAPAPEPVLAESTTKAAPPREKAPTPVAADTDAPPTVVKKRARRKEPPAATPSAPPARRTVPGKHAAPPEPVTVASEDLTVTATPRTPAPTQTDDRKDRDRRGPVVDLPEPEPQPEPARAGAPGARGPDSDVDVIDVLNRLVPSSEAPEPLDDPGDLRARLARTAALKKPGSRERQEGKDAPPD
jgi:hypothetical protein